MKLSIKFLAYLLIGTFVIWASGGCKSARELIEKGDRKDPSLLPEIARTKYPCITTAIVRDSTEYNKWKNALDSVLNNQPIDFMPAVPDTIRIKDSVKCPDQLSVLNYYKKETVKLKNTIGQLNKLLADVKPVENTASIEDSAKIKMLYIQFSQLNEVIVKRNKTIEQKEATIVEKDAKIKRRGKISLYLLIALCVSLTLNYILIRRK